jgi:hypothetical protein
MPAPLRAAAASAPASRARWGLTPAGQALEPAILALGRWGNHPARRPRPGEIVTPESVTLSLRAAFNAGAAAGLTASWELHGQHRSLPSTGVEGSRSGAVGGDSG